MEHELKRFQLREPIKHGSETISELKIRKPKAGDLRALPARPQTTDMLDLAGRLCALPPSAINELSIEDALEVMEIVGNFIQPGQQTGSSA